MNAVEKIIKATASQPDPRHPAPFVSLEQDTMAGWEVAKRFEVDEPIYWMELVCKPADPNRGLYSTSEAYEQRSALGKQSYFRLRKSGEIVLGEQLVVVESLRNDVYSRDQELERARKKIDALEKELAQVQDRYKFQQTQHQSVVARCDEIGHAKRQLEMDIGKIREHIGKKMMDEILGTKK